MSTLKGITRLPPGKTIKIGADGKTYLVSKGRRKFKTPAKTRKKIAAGLRRVKWPVLTIAAVGLPLGMAVTNAGGLNRIFSAEGFKLFSNSMVAYYTGFSPLEKNWDMGRLMYGLGPLLGVVAVRRLGVFRGVNNQLARMRIPLRLS